MPMYHRLSIAAVVVLLLVAGCGEVEPTATPVPATATRIALEPSNTPRLPTTYDLVETDACFTPDGNRLYFNSARPLPSFCH